MPDTQFYLASPDVVDGLTMARRCTCDGQGAAPALQWGNLPDRTKSLALIADDPDAPSGLFTHWIVWDIPPMRASDPVDLTRLGITGRNDFGKIGYGAPCPPAGHGTHHYRFQLHALDVESLELAKGARRSAIERAMEGHILAGAEIVGLYERRRHEEELFRR